MRVALFTALFDQLAPLNVDLTLGQLPQRGTGIGVVFYDVDPPAGTTDETVGMQLTIRDAATNDSRKTLNLSEQVFDLLHEQTLTTWGDVPINRVWRNSSADMGRDEDGAYVRADNYYLRCSRAGAHLTDT